MGNGWCCCTTERISPELPTAPPVPGFLCCGFPPSLAHAKQQLLKNYIKNHLSAHGTGTAEVRCEDGIATTGIGFLSSIKLLFPNAVLLYSASRTLILKTHNINNSTSTQMQMYYTHRYTSMYVFSCRGNMIFMFYKMNKENRKPRILGYHPNHTALKSAVHWKKTHNKKATYTSFQEKYLSFPICLRLMSTHKRLKSGLDENIQYKKYILKKIKTPSPFKLRNNTLSVCAQRQTWCCRTFSPNGYICF